jgi:hypothetical protein
MGSYNLVTFSRKSGQKKVEQNPKNSPVYQENRESPFFGLEALS